MEYLLVGGKPRAVVMVEVRVRVLLTVEVRVRALLTVKVEDIVSFFLCMVKEEWMLNLDLFRSNGLS